MVLSKLRHIRDRLQIAGPWYHPVPQQVQEGDNEEAKSLHSMRSDSKDEFRSRSAVRLVL